MKKSLATFLMVCLVLGTLISSAPAAKTDDADIRGEAQSFFNAIADMFDKKDVEGLVQKVIPGATLRYVNGMEPTIEEWKAKTLQEFAGIAAMKSKFTVEKAVSGGDTRIVTYKEIHNYVFAAEKGHKYRSVSRWTVTLAKTPQGLKAAHFVEHSEKTTRDGKPVKP